jgi:endonuclease/exonuclease/phosphatase (EEP) superfamily protein YafD
MQRLLTWWTTAALAACGLATAIGYLASWWPIADLPNHFSPIILTSALLGLGGLTWGWRAHRRSNVFVAGGLAAVAGINAVAIWNALATTAHSAQGSNSEMLTIVSFNIWSKNRSVDEAARWLADQNADVIVLQEMTGPNRERVKAALKATHPHVADCGCNDVVLLSRRPITGAGGQRRTTDQPALTWFNLADKHGREVRIIGLRPRYIFRSAEYAAHYDWLVRNANGLGPRVILAGDFNAAPWSWQMTRFARASGLLRHGTFAASYPSVLPLVLIDNVLTSPDIARVSFEVGPLLGSDHRPIVATVALD